MCIRDSKARDAVDFFKQTLGAENFFLELQNHGMADQAKVNRQLIAWSKEFGLKLVATNDVHYINKGDSCLLYTSLHRKRAADVVGSSAWLHPSGTLTRLVKR